LSEKENTSNNANRHATWLELFYDLVFVVVIFQLAHNLEEDFSLNGFLVFLTLFVPVWWSWTGAVFYATRFDTDDLGHRILILLQMVGAAFLAVYVTDALGDGSVGFALSYAAIRIILILEYVRTDISKSFSSAAPLVCICKEEKSIKGYVMAIPDVHDMILMLKAIVADSEFNEGIDILEKIYGYLSAEFVHFATRALPDREPDPYEFGKQSRTIRLWGFEGVAFCLQILDLLTDYYYRKMR
jgi:hypothetical protein